MPPISKYSKLVPGTKYNKLTVISFSHKQEFVREDRPGSSEYRYHYLFKCDCGNEKVISATSVVNDVTKSCGCNQLEFCKSNENLLRLNNLSQNKSANTNHNLGALKKAYSSYRKSAKDRSYEFTLTLEEFKILVDSNCFYCKTPPSNISTSKSKLGKYTYSGIDRKDNTQGYNLSNCVPCCGKCNWMKVDSTIEDFKEHIIKLYNNFING